MTTTMKSFAHQTSTLVPFLGALAVLAGGCVASSDGSESSESRADSISASGIECPDSVPANLTPATDQKLAFGMHGVGVQIYQCAASGTGYAWTFIAPEADLLDEDGNLVGKHFAGPTWRSNDGSSVVAAKLAAAPSPIAGAIPWLLLGAVSHDGTGIMTAVSDIQRLATTGGAAPATGCDADHVGATARVPYTADYFFYVADTKSSNPRQCGGDD